MIESDTIGRVPNTPGSSTSCRLVLVWRPRLSDSGTSWSGLLIDTPGMRELQLWDGGGGLGETFTDITELAATCKFRNCRHRKEPGCAVIGAVASGVLAGNRLESFRKLDVEREQVKRQQDEREQIERKRQGRTGPRSLRKGGKEKEDS